MFLLTIEELAEHYMDFDYKSELNNMFTDMGRDFKYRDIQNISSN